MSHGFIHPLFQTPFDVDCQVAFEDWEKLVVLGAQMFKVKFESLNQYIGCLMIVGKFSVSDPDVVEQHKSFLNVFGTLITISIIDLDKWLYFFSMSSFFLMFGGLRQVPFYH